MYPLVSADVRGGGRLRDEPKERLRRRLCMHVILPSVWVWGSARRPFGPRELRYKDAQNCENKPQAIVLVVDNKSTDNAKVKPHPIC